MWDDDDLVGEKSIRTFAALRPDEAAVDFLCRQLVDLKRVLPDAPIRWVWPENLHLTLRFFGETETSEQLIRLIASMGSLGVLYKPFTWRIGPPRLFPSRRRAAVIVADIEESEPLVGLVERIEKIAVNCGFAAETRKFRPHLTLGRIRRGTQIQLPRGENSGVDSVANEFVLMRSKTEAGGAVYSEVFRSDLVRR